MLPDPRRATQGLVRSDAAATSRVAAQSVRTPSARLAVLEVLAIADRGGLTDEEIQGLSGIRPDTARARRVELVRDGWVEDSGRTRPTETGNAATVWVISGPGRMQWARIVAGVA